MAVLSTVWKETHAYSLNGVHLIWQYLCDLPNRQIKITAKYIMYMVFLLGMPNTNMIQLVIRGGMTQYKHQQNVLAIIAYFRYQFNMEPNLSEYMRISVLAAGGLIHCLIPSSPLFNMHLMNV